MPTYDVDHYQIWSLCQYDNGFVAWVELYYGGRAVGRIFFYAEGRALPKNYTSPPTLHYPASQFATVMDILRQEKPLKFQTSDGGNGWIGTAALEPAGEEEAR